MDKIDILLVRACKSNNATKRLKSVYRRFYYSGQMSEPEYQISMTGILARIIDESEKVITCRYMMEQTGKRWLIDKWDDKSPLPVLTNIIRFMPCFEFKGYEPPLKFRSIDWDEI